MGVQVGGFAVMRTEDLQRVAPLWLNYSEAVREDPEAWRFSGDIFAKKSGDKPWIAEMYGYSFGAAAANVWHQVPTAVERCLLKNLQKTWLGIASLLHIQVASAAASATGC